MKMVNGMKYIECPEIFKSESHDDFRKTLFLGGGISGCPDWQLEMVNLLKDTDLIIVNPRRKKFDLSDKSMTISQIHWEYSHLKICHARLFWFPCETLCPITLFELGKFCEEAAPLFVGCHPDYKRKLDIEIQMKLAGRTIPISYSLKKLADIVKESTSAITDYYY